MVSSQRLGFQVLGEEKYDGETWQAQELSMICVVEGRVMDVLDVLGMVYVGVEGELK